MVWKRLTVDTPFHIDMKWWEQQRDFRIALYSQLCDECRRRYESAIDLTEVDWVDPTTGEVVRADALWMCLRTCCAEQPDFINEMLPLVTAVFRVLLLNDNRPLTPRQLHEELPWRQPEAILRVLGGRRIYMGIRPAM